MASTRRGARKGAGRQETAAAEAAAPENAAAPAAAGRRRRAGAATAPAKVGETAPTAAEEQVHAVPASEPAAARAKTVATPWGPARLVDELSLPQEAGDRSFASLVQLLEAADGERLVRFAYATDGVARRGPVTLRRDDLARLRQELAAHEELRAALDA